MKHYIQQFPTLILTDEVLNALVSASVDEKKKMSEALAYLDAFGLDKSFMGRRIKRVGGKWHLIVWLNNLHVMEFAIDRLAEGLLVTK